MVYVCDSPHKDRMPVICVFFLIENVFTVFIGWTADGAVIKTGLLIVLKQPNLFLLFPFVYTPTRPFSPPT